MAKGIASRRMRPLAALVAGLVSAASPALVAQPVSPWPPAAPEELGFDSRALAALLDQVRARDIELHHITILRRGRLVLSADFYPYDGSVVHDVASVTKSVLSTVVGIAIDRGYLPGVEAPVLGFFSAVPEARMAARDGRWQQLRLRHLLTMTSGLCADFAAGEAQLDSMRLAPDPVGFLLTRRLVNVPGERFAYCSGASQLLSAIVTRATGANVAMLARRHLFAPLGIDSVIWPADRLGNSNGWGDFWIRPLDLAKVGQLYLQRGVWNGQQILRTEWIAEATRVHVREPQPDGDGYGYRWWMPGDVPGLYEARGRGGQRLVVWPAKELVVVLIGSGFDPDDIGGPLVAALRADTALAPDPEGARLLERRRIAVASPLPASASGPLPALAARISGHTYEFAANELGLTRFRLVFAGTTEATLALSLDVQRSDERGTRVSRVGLDGRYRVTPSGRFGLPLAARGQWTDERTFTLTYNELANNHRYDVTIAFPSENRAMFRLRERSGLLDVTLPASATSAASRGRR